MYKVLIADDEGIVIDALKFIIHKNFPDLCLIESARSGRTLIELAEEFRPDIAFIDIQMPGVSQPEERRRAAGTYAVKYIEIRLLMSLIFCSQMYRKDV